MAEHGVANDNPPGLDPPNVDAQPSPKEVLKPNAEMQYKATLINFLIIKVRKTLNVFTVIRITNLTLKK